MDAAQIDATSTRPAAAIGGIESGLVASLHPATLGDLGLGRIANHPLAAMSPPRLAPARLRWNGLVSKPRKREKTWGGDSGIVDCPKDIGGHSSLFPHRPMHALFPLLSFLLCLRVSTMAAGLRPVSLPPSRRHARPTQIHKSRFLVFPNATKPFVLNP